MASVTLLSKGGGPVWELKGVPGVWNISNLEALCTPVQQAIDAASDQTEVSKTNSPPPN